jgi:hypothetical protein
MTSDGARVFFTTGGQLTADDTDTGVDLYMWDELTESVSRISAGTGGSGNSDSCSVSWIANCGIQVVPTNHSSVINGNEPPIDTALAAETGEIYFYSPEELDGSRGAFGARNLYVFRNGAPRHVATLDASRPVTRIQVTPDGAHMAMITSSQLTSYDNDSRSAMYRYNAEARTITCVSCRPDGDPPQGLVEGSQNGLFMTVDGRVFFSTEDALVPPDANGLRDVYEFVDGRAQLISSGVGDAGQSQNQMIGLVGVSADGLDVYFATVDTLVPQDENGPFLKFYDARTNGGFPYKKPPAPCAAADECHGPESSPPDPLPVGTGASLGSGGNAKARRLAHKRKRGAHRSKRRKARQCKRRRGKSCHRKSAQRRRRHEGGARP